MSQKEAELLDLLPSAEQAMETVALAEAEKASGAIKVKNAAEAEKRALIDRLSKPSGVSDAEVLKKATVIIQRAIRSGSLQVEVYRFPNALCTDGGRAINQQEKGWENTLTGVPREIYEFWKRHLQERGYKLICEIVDWRGGVPGDAALILKWG